MFSTIRIEVFLCLFTLNQLFLSVVCDSQCYINCTNSCNSGGPNPAPTGSVAYMSFQMQQNARRATFIGALSSADQDPTSVPAVTGQRAVGEVLIAEIRTEELILNTTTQIQPITCADVLEQVFTEILPARCVFSDLRNNTGKYSKATLTQVQIAIELAADALATTRDSNTAFHSTGAQVFDSKIQDQEKQVNYDLLELFIALTNLNMRMIEGSDDNMAAASNATMQETATTVRLAAEKLSCDSYSLVDVSISSCY